MGPLKLFVDANILFSAALGGSSFELVWDLAKAQRVVLLTSEYCRVEAEHNLTRKHPARLPRFAERLEHVNVVPFLETETRAEHREAAALPGKDAPVYTAAVVAKAAVLLTGDRKHFGALMARPDLPLRVRTVRDFLLELPS